MLVKRVICIVDMVMGMGMDDDDWPLLDWEDVSCPISCPILECGESIEVDEEGRKEEEERGKKEQKNLRRDCLGSQEGFFHEEGSKLVSVWVISLKLRSKAIAKRIATLRAAFRHREKVPT